jgi:multicomponent Na+:H+ antiporter subunit E
MTPFVWNLILGIAWVVVSGNFTEVNFLFGMLVGYGILSIASRQIEGGSTYVRKVPKIIGFIGFFIVDLIKANLRVAYDVVTPTHLMRPGVIAYPLIAEADVEITILGNLITVTPGTLSLDVSSDRKMLYIHAMYLDDEAGVRANIRELERRVLEIMR